MATAPPQADMLNTFLAFADTRQQTTEIKMQVTRVLEKVEKIYDKLCDHPSSQPASALASMFSPFMAMQMQQMPYGPSSMMGGVPGLTHQGLPSLTGPYSTGDALSSSDVAAAVQALQKIIADNDRLKRDVHEKTARIEHLQRSER